VRRVLLGLFPAPWRARYGEEFEALLEERPLGPFDVADVLLAAFDAHRHFRGLAAASDTKGFVMTLRIGGLAAVFGGLAFAAGLIASSLDDTDEVGLWMWLFVAGTAALLLAMVGLSAFQAREHPRLVWAAFIVPAVGAVVTCLGAVAMVITSDGPVLLGFSGWDLWAVGMLALVFGSGLFALANLQSGSVSRPGSVLLAAVAVATIPALFISSGLVAWEPIAPIFILCLVAAFAGGWVLLGVGAIRLDRTAPQPTGAPS